MIRRIVQDIERLFSSSPIIIASDFQKHFGPSDETLYLKGKVIFIDASVLSVALFLVKSGNKVQIEKYRYQYMDSNGEIEFRYDNANHHPEIRTFPHHKHDPSFTGEHFNFFQYERVKLQCDRGELRKIGNCH